MISDWKPGHSTIKTRYPYKCIESLQLFSNRPQFVQNKEGQVGVNIDVAIYQKFQEVVECTDELKAKQLTIDFLMDRAFDFQEALKVAEDQIAELLSEDPFLPEQFGFELIYKPETIHDSPIRLYQSKYNDKYTLHRPVQDVMDTDNYDPSIWILNTKNEDGTIVSEDLKFPCHRIAYAYFYAKGIKVMDAIPQNDFEEAVIVEERKMDQHAANPAPVVEENPKTKEKTNLWSVECNVENREAFIIDNIAAQSSVDAITKAKFMIETGEYGIEHVEFSDLSIVANSQ